MRVILVGFMGSGKTSLGKRLAKKLQYEFFDTDELIEKEAGLSVQQVFEQLGEPHFRELEQNLICNFPFPADCIIACGGGLPCYNNNMHTLKNLGRVIYLKLSADFLKNRLMGKKESRPLLSAIANENDLHKYISDSLLQREPHYSEAHKIIELEAFRPKQVINKLLDLL